MKRKWLCHFRYFYVRMIHLDSIVLIAGGQTGVDRAVFDFALSRGITCGGWCPKGRLAEDGTIPERYPVKEWHSPLYEDRTKQNILDSDGVLIVFGSAMDRGTRLTLQLAEMMGKRHYIHSLKQEREIRPIHNWMSDNQIRRLNIAGPRESNDNGIYLETLTFMNRLFSIQ
jgi:hypothetical protein